MKLKLFVLSAVCICCIQYVTAQTETWAKKQSMGYDIPARYHLAMTALNDKVYFANGYSDGQDVSTVINDFWEYTPATKTYRRLASTPRDPGNDYILREVGNLYTVQARLFYLGDLFYEYDFAANKWIKKAEFPGNSLYATGLVINNGIYVVEGAQQFGPDGNSRRFYAYNVATNKWVEKANYPLSDYRWGAAAFSLNGYGYFGGGSTHPYIGGGYLDEVLTNFYKYNPATNKWLSVSPLPEALVGAVGTTSNGKGYVGTGKGAVLDQGGTYLLPTNVWYEYNAVSDSWAQKAYSPFRANEAGCANVGSEIFVFGGEFGAGRARGSMCRYNATADTWQTDTINAGANRLNAMSFMMNNKIYAGGGYDGGLPRSDWWEYNVVTETWARKADIPGAYAYTDRSMAGNGNGKAYAIGGWSPNINYMMAPRNLLEYNPVTNKWATRAAMPGVSRHKAAIFSIGNYIYAGGGLDSNGNTLQDFYKYDIAANKWSKIANIPVVNDNLAQGSRGHFSLNGKGYVLIGTLNNGNFTIFLYQYDPASNTWTKKETGINSTYIENAFTVNNKIYFLVTDADTHTHIVEYDPITEESKCLTNAPISIGWQTVAADSLNAYLFGGVVSDPDNNNIWNRPSNQLWRFSPKAEAVDTIAGDLAGIPGLVQLTNSKSYKNLTLFDSTGAILAGLSSNGENGGLDNIISWSGRILNKTTTYRERFGWFGNNVKEPGMYFNRNILIENSYGDTTTMRIYCTPLEISNFVATFNTKYGTAYTQNDIKVLNYTYSNNLDPLNNLNGNYDSAYYKKLTPQIKNYGTNNEYRYFEFTSPTTYGEYYLVLSVPCNLNPKITASGSTANICPGTSLTLTASAGFAKYKWNTGDTMQQITVTAAGQYFVTVTDAGGCSKKSAATKVTYQACAAPAGLLYSNVSATGVKLSWNKVNCATSYEVQYKLNAASAWNTISVSDTTITLTGLTPAKKYLWRARTICNGGYSAYVDGTGFTTPAHFTAAITEDNAATVSNNWDISLSPNPAKSNAVLSIDGKLKNVSVIITDVLGKQVWQKQNVQTAQLKLPVDNLKPGVYLVTVNDGQSNKTIKLVKE